MLKREGDRRKSVAFSAWQDPHTLTEDQRRDKEEGGGKEELLEGSNGGLIREFWAQIDKGRERWIVAEKTFCECDKTLLTVARNSG